jgi:TIR domain-containing protein
MVAPPTFFFSHARQDRQTPGKYLSRFFEDLEIKLAQWAGVSLREKRLGTIDSRLRQSDDWDEELSRGLSNNRAFIAILTPLYFNRPNCGKELAVFLLRSPNLDIDQNGGLKGAQNVMTIRWLPENAYATNADIGGLIPPFLRLIEDTPGDDGRDPDRTQAIERYQRKGMEKCVQREPEYSELLDLFVERIRELPELRAAIGVSFATAQDAFKYDWRKHFVAPVGEIVSSTPAATAPMAPRALSSVVAFYITHRPFTRDPNAVEFADQLIAEPLSPTATHTNSSFAALLADVREAGVAEGLTVFHAAAEPVVPDTSKPLLDRLTSLSVSRILTVLVVDANVWPGNGHSKGSAVEEIIRSLSWTGLVLIPTMETAAINVDDFAARRGLPPRLVTLPRASETRVSVLRRAFVDVRGRVLSGSAENSPGAERVPLLKGTGGDRT